MVDVMPCYRLMYVLADVIASFIVEDVKPHGQMLLPIFHQLADVIAILYYCSSWYATTLHISALKMAGVIAKWQDGTATLYCFEDGRCYCHVARWNNHF